MIQQRWFIVIPPSGAAREVILQALRAFNSIPFIETKQFDCLHYLNAFTGLIKEPEHNLVTDLLNQSLVISCIDFDATHCLTGALSPVTAFSLKLLRKKGIKTIHWFYEDYLRALYWKNIISQYDYFCAIQNGPFPDICSQNSTVYHFLPTAHGGSDFCIIDAERPYDVAFVGIPSAYRISVLEALYKKGFKLAVGGTGWNNYSGPLSGSIVQNTTINHDQFMKLLQKSKIGINLSIENPENRIDVHISPRVYDILAAGCILVSENVPLLFDFLPNCHFHVFSNIEHLSNLMSSLIENHREEYKYSESNRKTIFKEHLYANRIKELIHLVS